MKFVKFTQKYSVPDPLAIEYADDLIEETINTKFLGMKNYNNLNSKNISFKFFLNCVLHVLQLEDYLSLSHTHTQK